MRHSRHRHAKKRALPLSRRQLLIVAPVVAGVLGVGAVLTWVKPFEQPDNAAGVVSMSAVDREAPLSRDGGERTASPTETPTATPTAAVTPTAPATVTPTPTPTASPAPTVAASKFTTAGLNVRTAPDVESEVLTVLDRGAEVGVTGVVEGEWAQIVYDKQAFWVSAEYLADIPPEDEPEISYDECESGSAVEDGLTADAIRVHRAVCANFPQVSSYGGLRSGDGGEHGEGRALDIMISDQSVGDEIAAFVRENHEILGVSEVIWWQQIWTVERSGEGWRPMSDRGDDTANHYDHVHVTVYGDSGG